MINKSIIENFRIKYVVYQTLEVFFFIFYLILICIGQAKFQINQINTPI